MIKKNKEDQKQTKLERTKQREAKREQEEAIRQRSKEKQSNQNAARLATTVSRSSRNRSPQRGGKDLPRRLEKHSDSSLEGTW